MNTIAAQTQPTFKTAQDLFDYVTSTGRVNYGLWWVLNKMSFRKILGNIFLEEGTRNQMTKYSGWISYRDAEFILSKISASQSEIYRDDIKSWWYNKDFGQYEFYHILPDGSSLHVVISRKCNNGNRTIRATRYDKHVCNMKGFDRTAY